MRIEHVAIWTRRLEALRSFYETHFQAKAGKKYSNPAREFESYFLEFESGGRLELMSIAGPENRERDLVPVGGLAHFAFGVGSEASVDELTNRLRSDGIEVLDGPRRTGDGYYESTIRDPDGNRVEITA